MEIKRLGLVDYQYALDLQRELVEQRKRGEIPDQLLLLEHPDVITLGVKTRNDRSHVLESEASLAAKGVALFETGRGGDVTYHGPGQLVVYPLIDLRRANLGVRDFVSALELTVIDYVAQFGIAAGTRRTAPGVYVDERKLASVGIRVRRGSSYHGIALNVCLDLEPFTRINPCGYAGLEMTRLADLGGPSDVATVARQLEPHLLFNLGL